MSFLNSIEKKSKKFDSPFIHWELNEPLTEEQINEIVKADIANPIEYNLNYDGTRAIDGGEGKFREGISDGGKALKFRCFITKENASKFPNLINFIQELQNKKTYEKISNLIGKDLSNSYVRVEVICDRQGFWLKPHCDIKEICNTEITDLTKMNINYDGTRAVDGGEGKFREGISSGGKAIKFRCFVSKDNSKYFPNLNGLIEELRSKDTHGYISELIKKDQNITLRLLVIGS